MKLYRKYVLPKLVHASCSTDTIGQERANIVPAASGRVLDIGFGSGTNLPFYDPEQVDRILALEPSSEMWDIAQPNVAATPIPVEFVNARAEDLPLEDESVDTAVMTFTLCTVEDVGQALAQIRRVLKKGGRLLFIEHGAAPEKKILQWQHRWEPIWSQIAGGCRLTRSAPELLEANNFQVVELSTGYIPGWKIDSYIYSGTAVPLPAEEGRKRGAGRKSTAWRTEEVVEQ